MNIWHDIPADRITPESFSVVVEISKGGRAKYELDKDTGVLRLDRILSTATHYPHNYGFIPRTFSDDGDPLDALVLCSEPIVPMALVQCYPIGVIQMEDSGSSDEKIIAVPLHDPVYNSYRSIDALPSHLLEEMRHFFTIYKELEGKGTAVERPQGRDAAVEVIRQAIGHYRTEIEGKGR